MGQKKHAKISTGGGQAVGQNIFGDFGARDAPARNAPSQEKKKTAGIRREKYGRAGKWVTVVHGIDKPFPRTEAEDYLNQLKKHLGAGGKLTKDGFEIQGDHIEAITSALESAGYKMKRTGA